jgi:hypothetical protein
MRSTITAHALDDHLFGHHKVQHRVDLPAQLAQEAVQRLGLGHVPRIAVEHRAPARLRSRERLAHQPQDDLVRHQLPGVHHLPGSKAEGRLSPHGVPQHVAGGDLRNSQRLREHDALGAFTGPRGAKKDHVHKTPVPSAGQVAPGALTHTAPGPAHTARFDFR